MDEYPISDSRALNRTSHSGRTELGTLPPGALILQLPVQRLDVAAPVIEIIQ